MRSTARLRRLPLADAVLRCEALGKTFVAGLLRRKVRALEDATLTVERGEIFGFVGPNGAGKTTCLKILMGLVFPTRGRAEVLGKAPGDVGAKRRVGFLPESPYFYDYLTGRELLDFVGSLFGLDGAERARRIADLAERTGLLDAMGRRLRSYSKGMLQRIGLAQALIGDPDLLVLDEPMSGLDPIGRKEVRDLIADRRARGKTVFFSTHILPDVEQLCDRVAIIVQGRVRRVGALEDMREGLEQAFVREVAG
jgi:ABC-2 type transport system ATP-binding protein